MARINDGGKDDNFPRTTLTNHFVRTESLIVVNKSWLVGKRLEEKKMCVPPNPLFITESLICG